MVEGPDGVGKSTICRLLASRLRAAGHRATLAAFPGNDSGSLGKLVHDLHHRPEVAGVEQGIVPSAMQALHVAAHLDTIEQQLRPILSAGFTVVLDRFWWSTWVYGISSGVDERILGALIGAEAHAWGDIKPALIVLVSRPNCDAPPRVVDEYRLLAEREKKHNPVALLDNCGAVDKALDEIWGHLGLSDIDEAVGNPSVRSFGQKVAKSRPKPAPKSAGHIAPLRPTVVFDTYWRFAAERQKIFFKRLAGQPQPWTEDPILRQFKFTNAYRASDRASQYLIRKVIYREDLPTTKREVFFRILLFKIFNKIETWELLEAALGQVVYEDFTFERYDRVLSKAMARQESIYSAAYIMPSAGSLGHTKKHRNHLALLQRMMKDDLPQRLHESRTMQRGFELFRSYPSIGDFLAYQYVTDVNYSELTNFTEMDFVVPGPGALDGIRKCFADTAGLSEPEIIRFMVDNQEREFGRLDLDFQTLWGRRLHLIDCQNLFCEVDKYSRVAHPEIQGISGRARIKQKYVPTSAPLTVWYPPKWGINARIADATEHARKQLTP